MKYSESDLELERFRDQYTAYVTAHAELRIYALIDPATIASYWRRDVLKEIRTLPCVPLYRDAGLDDLAESGPFVVACPAPVGKEPLRVLQSLLNLARRDNGFVSWVWAVHDVEPLVDHLQTLLHARLAPDDEDAWFFFHQPAFLPVLHQLLPDETQRYMFGPCLAWWCLDYDGALVELPGKNLCIPTACEAFHIPENVVHALQRAGAPNQVREWLQRARPDVLDDRLEVNGYLQRIAPLVERASGYGVTEKIDQVVYVSTGLLYDQPYDEHPALQASLGGFRNNKTSLIDAYTALGDDVWREVAAATRQRAIDAAIREHQANLRIYGWASIRTRIINETSVPRQDVQLAVVDKNITTRGSLGDIAVGACGPKTTEMASARVPIPGTHVSVTWTGPTGLRTNEVKVSGELPRAEGEGVAIVKFSSDWHIYISMHADEPKPTGRW